MSEQSSAVELRRRDGRSTTDHRIVSGRWDRADWIARRLLAAGDALSLFVSVTIVALVRDAGHLEDWLLAALVTLPGWLLLFKCYGLYERDVRRISKSTLDDVPGLFHAVLLGNVSMWALIRAFEIDHLSETDIVIAGVLCFVLVMIARTVIRRWWHRASPERTMIVGEPAATEVLARKIAAHPEYGMVALPPLAPAHAREALPGLVDREGARRLIVWSSAMPANDLMELLREAQRLGVKASMVPVSYDVMGPSMLVDDIEGLTVLSLNPPVLSRSSRMLKRSMDLVGASLILLLTLPLSAIIALAIKLDSPGPVFFRQTRLGRRGRSFKLIKFRTMVADAEARRAELVEQSRDPDWLHVENDPRITRVGRRLRFSSLDELPQLWNVLKGDMSLVGPRPLIESEDRLVEDWRRARLDLTPGITGLWQVMGRTNIPFQEMVNLDYLYVTNWSLWTDIRLMLRTIPAVLLRRGAN